MPGIEMSGALGNVRSFEFGDYEIVYYCVMTNFLAGTEGWFKRPKILVSSKLNSCAPSI